MFVNFRFRMYCIYIYTPSQIQDWYRQDKIQARKDRKYSSRQWIPWTRNTKIRASLTWPNHVLHDTSRKRGKDTKTRCTGSRYSLLNGKDWSSFRQDRTQSFFTKHSQLIVSRKLLWWNLEKSFTRKYICHLGLLQRFPSKIIGWKNWIQKLLEAAKTPNESNQNQKPNYQERRDPWVSNQQVRSLMRSEKMSLFGREGTKNSRTVRPVDGQPSSQSCGASAELVENVDADQTRTGRPVGRQQFTQLEEIDIDFRVPGLSHAVVEEAENFRVQELVKKIESHPHRRALQADLQQNNVYKPFSNNSKEMIRELGNVELFELCETIPKVQCSQCLLCWNPGINYCTCAVLGWKRIQKKV